MLFILCFQERYSINALVLSKTKLLFLSPLSLYFVVVGLPTFFRYKGGS